MEKKKALPLLLEESPILCPPEQSSFDVIEALKEDNTRVLELWVLLVEWHQQLLCSIICCLEKYISAKDNLIMFSLIKLITFLQLTSALNVGPKAPSSRLVLQGCLLTMIDTIDVVLSSYLFQFRCDSAQTIFRDPHVRVELQLANLCNSLIDCTFD